MMQPLKPKVPFAIFESFTNGIRLCIEHRRLFGIMSFLPFVATLITLVALRLLGPTLGMFWLPVLQLPSSFVIGLQSALILRFVILQEYPIMDDSADKAQRNRSVVQSGIVYAAITYFITGLYAGLLQMRALISVHPEAAGPWMPLILACMLLVIWGARWFWLHVPLAMNWPVHSFFERLGRWAGSLRVFLLFAVCSLCMNFVVSFVQLVIMAIAGKNPGGFFAAFSDGVVAAATVMLAVVFTACTAAAVKSMMRAQSTIA